MASNVFMPPYLLINLVCVAVIFLLFVHNSNAIVSSCYDLVLIQRARHQLLQTYVAMFLVSNLSILCFRSLQPLQTTALSEQYIGSLKPALTWSRGVGQANRTFSSIQERSSAPTYRLGQHMYLFFPRFFTRHVDQWLVNYSASYFK
jgi:hypothetical protein